MLIHPKIDPVIVSVGPLSIRWYGMMYLLGFLAAWLLGRYRTRRADIPFTATDVEDIIWTLVIGVIAGGRLGYVLFYDFAGLLEDPTNLVAIWRGGMSFHGGLAGVAIAGLVYARRKGVSYFQLMDFIAPLAPIGLGCGRLGNFINGELWGRPTDLPWGMIFRDPLAGMVPRHPSQLYELFLEGIMLFAIMWWFSAKPRPSRSVCGLFLILYGLFRFSVEFVRQPDLQLGFIAFGWLTMGQLLCVPMFALGAWLMWTAYASPLKNKG